MAQGTATLDRGRAYWRLVSETTSSQLRGTILATGAPVAALPSTTGVFVTGRWLLTRDDGREVAVDPVTGQAGLIPDGLVISSAAGDLALFADPQDPRVHRLLQISTGLVSGPFVDGSVMLKGAGDVVTLQQTTNPTAPGALPVTREVDLTPLGTLPALCRLA